ncbi:hypothetical protein [Methylobacter svalbardensis]|uniref:hypothetical protein n=1 Tax=Methylobacter svalbardensis TaxID=3080016 RepID=UPI0030EBB7EF
MGSAYIMGRIWHTGRSKRVLHDRPKLDKSSSQWLKMRSVNNVNQTDLLALLKFPSFSGARILESGKNFENF